MNSNHYWIYSGQMPKIFGVVTWPTFSLFILSFFASFMIWPALMALGINFIERYARMPTLEVFRRLMIRFGLMFSYRRSRELGSSYRSRLLTYHHGDIIPDRKIFKIFSVQTVLCFYVALFSYLSVLVFRVYEISILQSVTTLSRISFLICIILLILSVARDIAVWMKNKKS